MSENRNATAAFEAWKRQMEQPIGDVLLGVDDIEGAFIAGYRSRDQEVRELRETIGALLARTTRDGEPQ